MAGGLHETSTYISHAFQQFDSWEIVNQIKWASTDLFHEGMNTDVFEWNTQMFRAAGVEGGNPSEHTHIFAWQMRCVKWTMKRISFSVYD